MSYLCYVWMSLIWCGLAACVLRMPPPTPWPLVFVVCALRISGPIAEARGHTVASDLFEWASFALYLIGCFWDDRWGKPLASKLKSMALTAVNAASFKRQQSEAFALRGNEG
jgi:hypothetical protein